jgi:hypothetical protein
MPSLGMLIAVIAAGSVIYLCYLYRIELFALLLRPKKEVDHNEALKSIAGDWQQTGYIDFSVPRELRTDSNRLTEPHFFYLTIEEYRPVTTLGGGIAVERRWRRGSLADAREVAQNYYQFLKEHPDKVFNEEPRRLMGATRLLDHPAAQRAASR